MLPTEVRGGRRAAGACADGWFVTVYNMVSGGEPRPDEGNPHEEGGCNTQWQRWLRTDDRGC